MSEHARPAAQLARYEGPRTTDELRGYTLLLAGAENPRGMGNSVLPAQFRGNPAALAFAVEYARALDVAPVTAITGVHVIDGRPSASAGLISALIRRAGHRLRVSAEGTVEDGTLTGVATIVRLDDPDYTYRVEFTLADAERAELLQLRKDDNGRTTIRARSHNGKPTQWEKYPRAMVKARALTEVAREAAEDALLGIHYTPDELGAEVNEAGEVIHTITTAPPAPSDAPQAPQTAPTAGPGPSPDQAAERAAAPQEKPPSVNQLATEALTFTTLEELKTLWRRAVYYDLIDADAAGELEPDDIDALTQGEPPEHMNLGWLIQAAARYLDHSGRPVRQLRDFADQPDTGGDQDADAGSQTEEASDQADPARA